MRKYITRVPESVGELSHLASKINLWLLTSSNHIGLNYILFNELTFNKWRIIK